MSVSGKEHGYLRKVCWGKILGGIIPDVRRIFKIKIAGIRLFARLFKPCNKLIKRKGGTFMHCKKWVSMSLSSLAVVFVSFLLTMLTMGTTYALNHSSNITSSETWAAADNPHIVTTGIYVYGGATLTIEPGCLVKFNSGVGLAIGIYNSAATLNAVGTSGNPITFTSNAATPATGVGSFLRLHS